MPPNAFEGSADAIGGDGTASQAQHANIPMLDAIFAASREAEEAATSLTSAAALPATRPCEEGNHREGAGAGSMDRETKTHVQRAGHTTCADIERKISEGGVTSEDDSSLPPPSLTPSSSSHEEGGPDNVHGSSDSQAAAGGSEKNTKSENDSGMEESGGEAKVENNEGGEKENENILFIGGIPYDVMEDELEALFVKWGEVESIRLIKDKNKTQHKGYGFITFASTEVAATVRALGVVELVREKDDDNENKTMFIDVRDAVRGVGKVKTMPKKPKPALVPGKGANDAGTAGQRKAVGAPPAPPLPPLPPASYYYPDATAYNTDTYAGYEAAALYYAQSQGATGYVDQEGNVVYETDEGGAVHQDEEAGPKNMAEAATEERDNNETPSAVQGKDYWEAYEPEDYSAEYMKHYAMAMSQMQWFMYNQQMSYRMYPQQLPMGYTQQQEPYVMMREGYYAPNALCPTGPPPLPSQPIQHQQPPRPPGPPPPQAAKGSPPSPPQGSQPVSSSVTPIDAKMKEDRRPTLAVKIPTVDAAASVSGSTIPTPSGTSTASSTVSSSSKYKRDRRVFIGGLPSKMSEKVMTWFFEQWGTVESVRIIYDPETGKSKRYGFVTFAEIKSAEALKERGFVEFVDGKLFNVGSVRHEGADGGWYVDYFNDVSGGEHWTPPAGDSSPEGTSVMGTASPLLRYHLGKNLSKHAKNEHVEKEEVAALALAAAKASLAGVLDVGEIAAIAAASVNGGGRHSHSYSSSRANSMRSSRSVGSSGSGRETPGECLNKAEDFAVLFAMAQEQVAADACKATERQQGRQPDRENKRILVFGSPGSEKNNSVVRPPSMSHGRTAMRRHDRSGSGTVSPMSTGTSNFSSELRFASQPASPVTVTAAGDMAAIAKKALTGHVVMVTREMRIARLTPIIENGGFELRQIMERTGTLIKISPRSPASKRMRVEVRGVRSNVTAAWEDIISLCGEGEIESQSSRDDAMSRQSSSGCTASTTEEFLHAGDEYFGYDGTSSSSWGCNGSEADSRSPLSRSPSPSDSGSPSRHRNSTSSDISSSSRDSLPEMEGVASPSQKNESKLRVELRKNRHMARSRSTSSDALRKSSKHAAPGSHSCMVSIGGLSPDTKEEELHDFFSLFGVVLKASVRDNFNSDYGCVEFADPDIAAVVKRQRNLIFKNQIIEVRALSRYILHSHGVVKTMG